MPPKSPTSARLPRALDEHIVPVERVTLGEQVYREFADMLMEGRVKPGDRLPLRLLAERFGMSLMPVRDAVRILANEDALQLLPNRAVVVPVLTAARLREITLIRVNLEGAAAAEAAVHIDAASLARVRRHEREFVAAAASKGAGRVSRMLVANKALHFSTYAAAGMPKLLRLIESQWLQVGPLLRIVLEMNEPKLKSVRAHDFHARLLECLENGDSAGARAAVADDIQSSAEFIIAGAAALAAA